MLANQKTFNLKYTITDDWGSGHKVAFNLEALATAEDWKIGILFPNNYEIDSIYGAELSQENGLTYISGADWNKNLDKGVETEIILIVDEGKNDNNAPILPQLVYADSVDDSSSVSDTNTQPINNENNDKYNLNAKPSITDDWGSHHQVALDLEALVTVKNWKIGVSFSSDYTIDEIYGAELSQVEGQTYISGLDWNKNLDAGDKTEVVFIVDEGNSSNSDPILPQLILTNSIDDNFNQSEVVTPAEDVDLIEPTSNESSIISDAPVSEVVIPTEDVDLVEPVSNGNSNLVAQPDSSGQTINVDSDFGGDLEKAIAAAGNGDVVLLGANTYYTSGIKIDKDITIDGQQGSIINGGGTSETILYLTSAASGTTIQDVEITNGNNGIVGESASNLTLQNLEIHNIGISQTIRDGQNNIGINLNHAEGLQLLNSEIYNIGRKGVSVGDTDGGTISGISVRSVNLAAQHAQSHDSAGIKFFNTNAIVLKDSYFTDINANHIWNDTTNGTIIDNNIVENAGKDFLEPSFNDNVSVSGIYNEKSSNSLVKNNTATSVNGFAAFEATEFSVETMTLENNDFSSTRLGTTDYWVNEEAEKLIATTEDPDAANFSLFADEYYAQANIG